jgi:enoyl-[acyl-carrier protein] reductase I
MGLLDGKKGLILNIANDRSIAWHVANNAIKHGATCGYGFLPNEKMERRVRMSLQEMGVTDPWMAPCDVSKDEDIEKFMAAAKEKFGTIDFLVHSIAFADRNYLRPDAGVFTSTPRGVFSQAMDISAYSLIGLTRAAVPLMPNGGSIIAMTYVGGEKVVPGYNVMGVAKAALESTARYLAFDLGTKKIRVNTISAGPVETLSSRGVGGFEFIMEHVPKKAPLKRNIEADEVGRTAVYLLSDLSCGVTGETHYVDAGFRTVGL